MFSYVKHYSFTFKCIDLKWFDCCVFMVDIKIIANPEKDYLTN